MAFRIFLAALPGERLQHFRTTVSRLREEGTEEALRTTWLDADKIVLTTHYFASAGTTDQALTDWNSEKNTQNSEKNTQNWEK